MAGFSYAGLCFYPALPSLSFFNEVGSCYETKAVFGITVLLPPSVSWVLRLCVRPCACCLGKLVSDRIIIIFLSLSGSILSTHQLHLLFFWANCYSLVCTLLTTRSVFQCQELKCVKLRFSNDTYCFVLDVVWFAFFPESWVYWPHPGESWPAEHLYAKVRWPAEGT